MSRGTVIYIGGFELPDKNAAAHRVLNNAKIFRELGFRVVFISVDKELCYESEILHTKKEVQGFECWFTPYPKTHKQWGDYLFSIKNFKKILTLHTDVKAVICYNYQAIALWRIANYCGKRNIKIFADCTEWPSTKGMPVVFRVIKEIDTFLRMCIIQKRLDGLLVISRYLERYYKKCKNCLIMKKY